MTDLQLASKMLRKYGSELAFFGISEQDDLHEFVTAGRVAGYYDPRSNTLEVSENSLRELIAPFLDEDFQAQEEEDW